jgi:predicted ArsR family transcriptional regulator
MKMSKRMQNWITTLMDSLDEFVDDEECRHILENCGRECIPKSTIRKAKDLYEKSESLEDFLERYAINNKHLQVEDSGVFIVYPRCFCSLVNKIPVGQISPTWCNCSKGWVKALFKEATGRSVDVILEKSVIKGDDGCRLMVIF